jgi:predicted ATPase
MTMLTRLKVTGFKNLVDVDVRFGPFTCIAGANGTGKSNLFDAIGFLSALADHTLVDAASSVRGEASRTADIRSLFHHFGDRRTSEMSFEAEMIVPLTGVDDLGQDATASITFLRYSLAVSHRGDNGLRAPGPLEIRKEELVHINQNQAEAHLLFPHAPKWRGSAVTGRRTASPFISTAVEGGNSVIKLHQDRRHGRPLLRSAGELPRSVLSASNAAESPTVLMARREMQSWRLLQLEPSALRRPDDFKAPAVLGSDGSHLAATLYHLAHESRPQGPDKLDFGDDEARVYAQVANRLASLIDDAKDLTIDEDQKRELLTLIVTDRNRTPHPARVLSDGTLRFLALAVLELDPRAQGLLCLEEPENGIHPERIPAMLRLLQDIAVDPEEPVSSDNPLRQVIVNTHSPAVVGQVPDDSLLVAQALETTADGDRFNCVSFGCLPGTWRDGVPEKVEIVPKGELLAYLNPIAPPEDVIDLQDMPTPESPARTVSHRRRRVADRPDLQVLLPFSEEAEVREQWVEL